jgi:hypothetical protein
MKTCHFGRKIKFASLKQLLKYIFNYLTFVVSVLKVDISQKDSLSRSRMRNFFTAATFSGKKR